MDNIAKQKKYFKRKLLYFFEEKMGVTPTGEEVELLFNYHQYNLERVNLPQQTYESILKEYTTQNPEADTKLFEKIFSIGTNTMVSLVAEREMKINDLTQRLKIQENKNRDLKNDLVSKIKTLEGKLKDRYPTLAKMHLAYKAAQENRKTLIINPGENTRVYVKNTANFRTWVNQTWKYGKTKPGIKGTYALLDEENDFDNRIPAPHPIKRNRRVPPQDVIAAPRFVGRA